MGCKISGATNDNNTHNNFFINSVKNNENNTQSGTFIKRSCGSPKTRGIFCEGANNYGKIVLLWTLFYLSIGLFLIYLYSVFIEKYPSIVILTFGVAFVSLAISFRFFLLFLELILFKYSTNKNCKNSHYDNNNYIHDKEGSV